MSLLKKDASTIQDPGLKVVGTYLLW